MKCSQFSQALQLYIDGQLSWPQVRALEAHVARCRTCRADLLLLQEIAEAVHTMPIIREPTWLTAAIMARIAQEPRRQERSALESYRPSLPETVAAATLSTAITALFVIFQTPARAHLLPLISNQTNKAVQQMSPLIATLTQPGASMPGWAIWLLWASAGFIITLLLAGPEVRSNWRNTLRQWLSPGE
jgi:hypothetical protein